MLVCVKPYNTEFPGTSDEAHRHCILKVPVMNNSSAAVDKDHMQVLNSRSHSHNSHTLLSASCSDWLVSPVSQTLCTKAAAWQTVLGYSPVLLAQAMTLLLAAQPAYMAL